MSDVDVIVVDLDGGEMLQACVASIARQTRAPRRLIVFDNGSRMPVGERVNAGKSPLSVIRSEVNLGFAGGVNAAYRHTDAPYLALVNNDVVLDDDWLAAVRDALERDEKLAAVQTILRRDSSVIDGAGIDIRDGTFRQIGYGTAIGTPLHSAWGVSATAALYRRAALGDFVFDRRFFAYYEDVELCARLHENGWRTAVLPVDKATHRGSASAPLLGRDALRLRTRNRYWVARLHPGVGKVGELVWEDVKLLMHGRSSLCGLVQGLFGTMNAER